MPINITHVAKNSVRFSLVGLVAAAVGLPVSIYVAAVLSPEKYGTYGILGLWLAYASLVSPGIYAAGRREIPVFLGQKKDSEATKVQNISLSGELIYTILPFAVIIGASFFFTEPIMRFGLLIIGATYLTSQFASFWSGTVFIREKFNIAIKGNLILAVLAPLIIAASVKWLGIYSLLMAPLIANIVVWIFYLKISHIGFRFTWDKQEVIRLLKVGIALQLINLVYWGFRFADKTVVASMLSRPELGLYTYALMFTTYAQVLPTDFAKVLTPILWRESNSKDFSDAQRIAIYVALGTAILIPIAQLGYYLVMRVFTVQYSDSIPIFNILCYNVYLAMVVTIPSLILTSSKVNRQNAMLLVYTIGLALEVGLAILAVKLGYGIKGVALVAIGVQALITIASYLLVHRHLLAEWKFYILLLMPLAIATSFYFYHSFLAAHTNIPEFAGLSILTQAIAWGLVLYLFYRKYISMSQLRPFLAKVWAR